MVQEGKESFECKVSARRMWHGLFKDAHHCLPKAIPSKVVSVEYPLGQHGFELPGAERIIKLLQEESKEWHETEKELHKDILLDEKKLHEEEFFAEEKLLHKDEGHAKEELHKVEAHVEKEGKKIGKEVREEEFLAKKKAEEAISGVEKEAGKVKEKAEYLGEEVKKEDEHIKKGVGGAVQKGLKCIKEVIGGAAYKAASEAEKLAEKEKEETKESIEKAKEAVHKLGEHLKKEEVWVKEKIGEVDYEASKITIHVVEGGLIGILFKHYKHTFELKECEGVHGSTLHWTSEFETLSSKINVHHSYHKLKEHVFMQFHGVEDYLLKHDDYA